jgi:hypothetical protein
MPKLTDNQRRLLEKERENNKALVASLQKIAPLTAFMSKSSQHQNRFAAFSSTERYLLNYGLLQTLRNIAADANDNPDELENVLHELTLMRGLILELRDKRFKDEWNSESTP